MTVAKTDFSNPSGTGTIGTDGLIIGGVEIIATPEQLNAVPATTASAAELNLINGSVAGTAVASKALVLGANKNVDVLAVADLKLGAGAGTSVTATAAELNKLASAGAIVASGTKVVNTPATKINYTTGDLDIEADIIAAINASNISINAILTALIAFGIMASPE